MMSMTSMSIQTCLPSGCKNRHPMKMVPRTQSFLRHGVNKQSSSASAKLKSANRRSAVERLEESKANYVKSERVLDSKQEFKNSCHLHVTTGSPLNRIIKTSPKSGQDFHNLSSSLSVDLNVSCGRHSLDNAHTKSLTPTRLRAKSHSEGRDTTIRRNLSFASRGSTSRIGNLVDIESQLKRLLTSSSKENIGDVSENICSAQTVPSVYKPPEVPRVHRGYSDPTHKVWNEGDSANAYGIHKSMPNLSPPSRLLPALQTKSFHSKDSDSNGSPNKYKIGTPPGQSNLQMHGQPLPNEDTVDSSPKYATTSRRFSNGTGTLHLTAYIPQTTPYRHPVSRSKSDVSHRYAKPESDLVMKKNNNYADAEIERFFDTMGLDTDVGQHIASPSSVSSPPCFFESVSSVDSYERSTDADSEESLPATGKEGLRNCDLKVHGPSETSIVEKNARVIKWLYNCRKATQKS